MPADATTRILPVRTWESADIPLIEVSSKHAGPTINVLGGLGGTAYPGIETCRILAKRLCTMDIRGRIRLLPVVDVAGFFDRASHFSPLASRPIAEAFGSATSETEMSGADEVVQVVSNTLEHTDFHVDVRGGELTEFHGHWVAIPHAEAASQKIAVQMAQICGADVRVAIGDEDPPGIHPGVAGVMAAQGIPSAILSYGGGSHDVTMHADILVQDVLRILTALGAIDGIGIAQAAPNNLVGPRIWGHTAHHDALWVPHTSAGSYVKSNEVLGHLWDYFGNPLEEVVAPFDGYVMTVTTSMAVQAAPLPDGDPWFAQTALIAATHS